MYDLVETYVIASQERSMSKLSFFWENDLGREIKTTLFPLS